MTTTITLEDGRVFGASNSVFDSIIESAAKQLERRADPLEGLSEWLLDQRCEIQGPGVGSLDMRELSARARSEFREACFLAYKTLSDNPDQTALLSGFAILIEMWKSIDRGEPPEKLTSQNWRVSPPSGYRRGPG
jgi:hypothetical protein